MKKIVFGRVRDVFSGFMIFVFTLSPLLVACQSSEEEIPEEKPSELAIVQRRLGNEQLISLAVCRMFDGEVTSAKSFFQNMEKSANLSFVKSSSDDNTLLFKYDFDFVKINDAVQFIARSIDFPFLNELCGEGEIEIFLTSFNTYLYEDEAKDENRLIPYIYDDLIVFRGEWGIYSCLSNTGSFRYDDMNNLISSIVEYSSHKRFGENSIEKDFTPPLYQFFMKTENNVTSLSCRTSDVIGIIVDAGSMQWTELENGDVISSDELFSTKNLCDMPQSSQNCTITAVGDDFFMVSGVQNLEKIFFDEYTLFFAGEKPVKSTNFAKGDVVTITFDQPYQRYNPKVALANIISLII